MKRLVKTTFELPRKSDESLIPCEVKGNVIYHFDKKYGADADGNRGECRCIIDDVVDVQVYEEILGRIEDIFNEKGMDEIKDAIVYEFFNELEGV